MTFKFWRATRSWKWFQINFNALICLSIFETNGWLVVWLISQPLLLKMVHLFCIIFITWVGSISYFCIFMNKSSRIHQMHYIRLPEVNKFLIALKKLLSLPWYFQKISPFSLETTLIRLLKITDTSIYKSEHNFQFLIFCLPFTGFSWFFSCLFYLWFKCVMKIFFGRKNFLLFKNIPVIGKLLCKENVQLAWVFDFSSKFSIPGLYYITFHNSIRSITILKSLKKVLWIEK